MKSSPHWRTITVDGITYAGGHCWCPNPDAEKHYLGFIPSEGYDNDE